MFTNLTAASRIHLNLSGILSSPARTICLVVGIVMVPVSGGFSFRADWATALWPWPDDRMSYIFVSSIGLAMAAVCLLTAFTGEIGGLSPILLEVVVSLAGMTTFLFVRAVRNDEPRLLLFAIGLLAIGLVTWLAFRRTRNMKLLDERRLPVLLRWVSGIFVILLGLTGILLVLQIDGAFPWNLKPETSSMFGWIFIGAACLFAWIFIKPQWAYMVTALVGFLAYDLMLIGPYAQQLIENRNGGSSSLYSSLYSSGGVTHTIDERRLIAYIVTLAVSAGGALWLLFLNPATRFKRPGNAISDRTS